MQLTRLAPVFFLFLQGVAPSFCTLPSFQAMTLSR
jgi:hypothetical protein